MDDRVSDSGEGTRKENPRRSHFRFFVKDSGGTVIAEEDDEDRALKTSCEDGSVIYRLSDGRPLYVRETVNSRTCWVLVPND